MVEAGCERIFDMTSHSAMLLGALSVAGRAMAMLSTANHHLRMYPFDAAVVIDSPVLHLPVAYRALSVGVPVLYYIAPQTWAWGAGRVQKLRNWVDQVAVILPFEEEHLRSEGVNATYVGHPLGEQMAGVAIDQSVVDQIRSRGIPVVALLPGSRKHVVQEVLRGQLEAAEAIASAIPGTTFGVSIANEQVAPIVGTLLAESGVEARPYPGQHAELTRAADLVLVASGTTTLETAFHGRPMIVMYNASRVFYHLLGRWMIRTPYLSLPNILAGREIVPEFMPYYRSTAPIARRAIELLRSPEARRKMVEDLQAVVEPLRATRASERTAELLLDMIDRSPH
jgi:lipid-A-disaccharide synthase